MELARRLLRWMLQLLSPAAQPSRASQWDPQTNPVDVQKIARELRLREEGRRLGAAGVPLDLDTTLCSAEEHALLAIEQARSDYLEWGQLRLRSLKGELDRLDVRGPIKAAEDAADEFERLASAAITANATQIGQLADTARARQAEFQRFRDSHNRSDLPHYPVGMWKVLAWTFAIFLITVEALLNASFFAKGLSGGLIDGFTEALIASMLNVLVCLAFGALAIRYVNHVRLGGKVLGIGGVFLSVGFVITLALLVSHYREALVLRLADPQSAAITNILADPLGLKQVSSWYLFFVSVAFGALALADGYKLDDPYPGYGQLHRQLTSAVEEYTAAMDEMHGHLEMLKSEALAKLDRALAKSGASIASFKGVISDKARCRADLNNLIFDAEPMLRALLAEFRTENIVARREKGYGVPPSFASIPAVEDRAKDMPDFSTEADEKSLQAQEQALHRLIEVEPQIRGRIQAAYNAKFGSLNTLFGHFDGVDLMSRIVTSSTAQPVGEVALGGS